MHRYSVGKSFHRVPRCVIPRPQDLVAPRIRSLALSASALDVVHTGDRILGLIAPLSPHLDSDPLSFLPSNLKFAKDLPPRHIGTRPVIFLYTCLMTFHCLYIKCYASGAPCVAFAVVIFFDARPETSPDHLTGCGAAATNTPC